MHIHYKSAHFLKYFLFLKGVGSVNHSTFQITHSHQEVSNEDMKLSYIEQIRCPQA